MRIAGARAHPPPVQSYTSMPTVATLPAAHHPQSRRESSRDLRSLQNEDEEEDAEDGTESDEEAPSKYAHEEQRWRASTGFTESIYAEVIVVPMVLHEFKTGERFWQGWAISWFMVFVNFVKMNALGILLSRNTTAFVRFLFGMKIRLGSMTTLWRRLGG